VLKNTPVIEKLVIEKLVIEKLAIEKLAGSGIGSDTAPAPISASADRHARW